jgi:hypothetical protein
LERWYYEFEKRLAYIERSLIQAKIQGRNLAAGEIIFSTEPAQVIRFHELLRNEKSDNHASFELKKRL